MAKWFPSLTDGTHASLHLRFLRNLLRDGPALLVSLTCVRTRSGYWVRPGRWAGGASFSSSPSADRAFPGPRGRARVRWTLGALCQSGTVSPPNSNFVLMLSKNPPTSSKLVNWHKLLHCIPTLLLLSSSCFSSFNLSFCYSLLWNHLGLPPRAWRRAQLKPPLFLRQLLLRTL